LIFICFCLKNIYIEKNRKGKTLKMNKKKPGNQDKSSLVNVGPVAHGLLREIQEKRKKETGIFDTMSRIAIQAISEMHKKEF